MLATRERVFREHGIDSLPALRAAHAAGRIPELVSADVILLVDGFAQLRTDFEELEDSMVTLLQRGGSFGIHVVLAMTRWNELRMAHQPLIGTRLELRLNDPADSLIGRKLAATIRADQPGRLLTEESLFAQAALPVLDDTDDESMVRRSRRSRRVRPPAGKDPQRPRSDCCRPTSPRMNCLMLWTYPRCCRSGCGRTPWRRPSSSWGVPTST
jgi:FtsK/SpoIIIE family